MVYFYVTCNINVGKYTIHGCVMGTDDDYDILSRERSHIPPGEKKNHLERCRLVGDM